MEIFGVRKTSVPVVGKTIAKGCLGMKILEAPGFGLRQVCRTLRFCKISLPSSPFWRIG